MNQIDLDANLRDDLARIGLIVTFIHRTDERLVVATRTARLIPIVGVVRRGPHEQDEAFARLATKVLSY